MLTSLRIENFKAWKATGDIRLAPLTVVFGTNSAGKTSLTQFLLMMKQTVESSDRTRVLHPRDRNALVDLGTFRDFVFDHQLDSSLSFGTSFGLPSRMSIRDPRTGATRFADSVSFQTRVRRDQTTGDRLRVDSMNYALSDVGNPTLAVGMSLEQPAVTTRGRDRYRLDVQNYEFVRNVGRKWPLPAPIRFYGFPDEAIAYYQNTGFLADLTLALESQFSRVVYVGPLRIYPDRSYVWSGEAPDHVGYRGERVIEALLAAHSRRISRAHKKRGEPFHKVIARWLLDLNLIYSFEVKPIGSGRKEYEVLVSVRPRGSTVNLTDVGFGVSQLLPVIVECFYVPRHSTIIFEQPEIHLHPSVQAGLADLFIETIHGREHGKNRDIQLIVESHSEHFLRRLQRRVAEEALRPEEVAMYFCEPGPSGSTIRELDVDMFGNITNWPQAFFGDEMEDVVAMTNAAMKRQAKK